MCTQTFNIGADTNRGLSSILQLKTGFSNHYRTATFSSLLTLRLFSLRTDEMPQLTGSIQKLVGQTE